METVVQTEYVGLQQAVLTRVHEQPGDTPRQISDYLEADRASVRSALSRLNAGSKVFVINGQYYPITDDFDRLVISAQSLEQAVPSNVPAWRRWWRRLGRLAGAPWLRNPATYSVAALIGYSTGRWLG